MELQLLMPLILQLQHQGVGHILRWHLVLSCLLPKINELLLLRQKFISAVLANGNKIPSHMTLAL
jgi:hypothetical protein